MVLQPLSLVQPVRPGFRARLSWLRRLLERLRQLVSRTLELQVVYRWGLSSPERL